jgi:CoA:oxalate CoA-transferase
MKPLDGVVVLDLTRYLAGPYCTLLLAGLGAEVIRVESRAGDPYRDRPPFAGPKGMSDTRQTDDDMPYTLLHRGRNKKSITLNLRAPAGVDVFRRLCGHADVVVENYLPGTLEKMGLAFPVLHAANPRLILCSISGFGQQSPYRDWRAFDPIIQAMSGLSSITGYPDRPPVRAGAAISDTTASLYGVIGILSALRARERTDQGDWIDIAMMDGTFFLLADILEPVAAGATPQRLGNGHPGTVPFNVYRARDGWVSLCAVTAEEWRHVLRALGREDLSSDPRFDPGVTSRQQHREDIDALMGEWIGARTVDEAVTALQKHHVPAGPVRDLREAFDDEHLLAREMVVPLSHPLHGPVPGARGVGMPIKFQEHPAGFDAPAPVAGAHNEEIYGRLLGLGADAIAKLRADGVI